MTTKKNKKYLITKDSMNYKNMSVLLKTKFGYQMNHATTRNSFIQAMNAFLKNLFSELKIDFDEKKINDLTHNNEMHYAISDILYQLYKTKKIKFTPQREKNV